MFKFYLAYNELRWPLKKNCFGIDEKRKSEYNNIFFMKTSQLHNALAVWIVFVCKRDPRIIQIEHESVIFRTKLFESPEQSAQ